MYTTLYCVVVLREVDGGGDDVGNGGEVFDALVALAKRFVVASMRLKYGDELLDVSTASLSAVRCAYLFWVDIERVAWDDGDSDAKEERHASCCLLHIACPSSPDAIREVSGVLGLFGVWEWIGI